MAQKSSERKTRSSLVRMTEHEFKLISKIARQYKIAKNTLFKLAAMSYQGAKA